MQEALLILCTCPDEAVAARLARALVDGRLAACVNVLPGIRSIYRWQEKTEEENEVLLLIKTMTKQLAAVEAWLQANHPYDVPEIVALPARHVNRSYLEWLTSQVSAPADR